MKKPDRKPVDPKNPSLTPFDVWLDFRNRFGGTLFRSEIRDAFVNIDGHLDGVVKLCDTHFGEGNYTADHVIRLVEMVMTEAEKRKDSDY